MSAKAPGRKRALAAQRARQAKRAAWQRVNEGVIVSEVPLNLPNKPDLADEHGQAGWVDGMVPKKGTAAVVECYPALASEMREHGLYVAFEGDNPGGTGNAAVSRKKFASVDRIRCTYQARAGHTVLHMRRVVTKHGLLKHTSDVVHLPSIGKYKTSATFGEQKRVLEQVARRKASTRTRTLSGDMNMPARVALGILRAIDKRWRYLGGAGVEATFGIGVKVVATIPVAYGKMSDHKHTERVVYGIRGRVGTAYRNRQDRKDRFELVA